MIILICDYCSNDKKMGDEKDPGKKGVTGIDLMVAGPVEFQEYNLHELQPLV